LERKVSPARTHAKLQSRFSAWLEPWAGERGEVGSEWRFYFLGQGERPSSLLPDVAYMSYERLPRTLPEDAREHPRIAPDIAVEIWSPGDRKKRLEEKIALYFAYGAKLVMVVYPKKREIAFHSPGGACEVCEARGSLLVPGYEDLALDADALFRDV
jgi:Uma2 family endonuclease